MESFTYAGQADEFLDAVGAMQTRCLNRFFEYCASHGALDRAVDAPDFEPARRFDRVKAAHDAMHRIAQFECASEQELWDRLSEAGDAYETLCVEFLAYLDGLDAVSK